MFHLLIGGAEDSHGNGLDAGQGELKPLVQSVHRKREVLIREKKREF